MRFQTSIFSARYESLWDSSLNNTSKLFLWENSSDIHLKIPIHTYIQEAFCILSMLLFVPNKFTCKLHNHGILRPPKCNWEPHITCYRFYHVFSRLSWLLENLSPPLIPTNIEKVWYFWTQHCQTVTLAFFAGNFVPKKYLLAFNDTHNSVVNHIQRIL